MNLLPSNKRVNPVVKTASMLPIYSEETPVKPRLSLGKIRRPVPVEGATGKFNIKPVIPMREFLAPKLRKISMRRGR